MAEENKKKWSDSLEKRRNMTFDVKSSLFRLVPPFPREITLDINNRCNHKCFFCAHYIKISIKIGLNLDLDKIYKWIH